VDNALKRLQQLLNELFQINDAVDLDFGIYRIMKHKRAEVMAFVDKRLPEIVDEGLESGALARLSAQAEERRQVTDQIRENFGEYAIGPSGELKEAFHATPLGKRYLALPPEAPETGSEQIDVSIFKHLYTFFSHYYDRGDFLSKRRYSKRQKYAVPYNGEEVYLHWANSDQYYIKTGSYFLDYRYEAPNEISVRFQVVSADIERDNVKEADRRFVPRPDEVAYDAETRTLTIPFDWRPLTDAEKDLGKKQTEVDERSIKELLARFEKEHDARHALDAKRDEDSEGKPVSHLEYHLRRYTAKNTSTSLFTRI
jgi:adenine-specific DNA-methyltransferase